MASRSFTLRTLLARGVLALLLVFAQQQATLHWLSHAIDSVEHKAKHGPSEACDECAGLAALDAMALPALPVLALPPAGFALADAAEPASVARAPQLAFRSRAPPVLS